MKINKEKILNMISPHYNDCRKELLKIDLTSDDDDRNVEEKINDSRKFMKKVIEYNLPYVLEKHLVKKWTKKAFLGLTSQNYQIYPLMFFTALFVDGSELQRYQYMRYEYMKYMAEYIYFFEIDIRNLFLQNKIEIPTGFDTVYEEFRRLLAVYHRRCMAVLLYLIMSAILFFSGILIGVSSERSKTYNAADISVIEQYEGVSDSFESDVSVSESPYENEGRSSE